MIDSHLDIGEQAKTTSVEPKPVVWTIAGSDSGGGAGLQADLLTITDLGCHCCTVITAITAQNSVAVDQVEAVSVAMLASQLQTLKADLYPNAVKIGLIANQDQLLFLADWLDNNLANVPVIVDPVLVATCGEQLQQTGAALDFSPFAGKVTLITPNNSELCSLTGVELVDDESFKMAATTLWQQFAGSVLAKGGDCHWQDQHARDLLLLGDIATISPLHRQQGFWLTGQRVDSRHSHGSGCTLASAIAALVAKGLVLPDAVLLAKAYVTEGLRSAQAIGRGPGPLARTGLPANINSLAAIESINANQAELLQTDATSFTALPTPLGIYPVVADVTLLESLLQAGANIIQLRIKTQGAPDRDVETQIIRAIKLGYQYQAAVFINDHWRLAIKHGAFGVHLGQEDVSEASLEAISQAGLALGLSSHGLFEALLAQSLQPSYLALGHIFATTTKTMPSNPQGLSTLALLSRWFSGHVPTVAIGGIDADNLADVIATGVDGIAVVRAITAAADPAVALTELTQQWEASHDYR